MICKQLISKACTTGRVEACRRGEGEVRGDGRSRGVLLGLDSGAAVSSTLEVEKSVDFELGHRRVIVSRRHELVVAFGAVVTSNPRKHRGVFTLDGDCEGALEPPEFRIHLTWGETLT